MANNKRTGPALGRDPHVRTAVQCVPRFPPFGYPAEQVRDCAAAEALNPLAG
jgi:hypothetical protein